MCECKFCYNKATHFSRNTDLNLCDECYTDLSDMYKVLMEREFGCSLDEHYKFEGLSDSNNTGESAEFDFDEMVNEYGVEFLSENYPDRNPISMEDINEYLNAVTPMEIIRLCFNGERYGYKYDSFNPNDECFLFDGYGNLISIPYLDDYLLDEIDEVEFKEWCKEKGYIED